MKLPHPKKQFTAVSGDGPLTRCLSCDAEHLYLQKDFPRKIAIPIVIAGAIVVPWTYGLSLIAVALIDLIIYQCVPWMTVCYRCRSEYRKYPKNPEHKEFDRNTDELYQYGKKIF